MAQELTRERLRELLAYDRETGVFRWIAKAASNTVVGAVAGSLRNTGYLSVQIDRQSHLCHRLAWLDEHGFFPKDVIDHRNGVRTDNRIENLRDVPRRVNSQNIKRAHAGSVTGLLGAHFHRPSGRFIATIRVDGGPMHLGYFESAEEAHCAYIAAKRRLHEGCTL